MSWIQTAKVGQRVVCIRETGPQHKESVEKLINVGYVLPKKYEILTIRQIRLDTRGPGLLFKELDNPVVRTPAGILEISFAYERFKPLDESRLDIFRAMLVEKPQHADA